MKTLKFFIIIIIFLSCKTQNAELKIKETLESKKYLTFNIFNFNFSDYNSSHESSKGNYAIVYGKSEKWDSAILYHKKQNKIEKIIYLGNCLYKCSFLNSTYKSQNYIDTVYSNLKDTVIYFRDIFSKYDNTFLGTQSTITVSDNKYSKIIRIVNPSKVKIPVLTILKQIQKNEANIGPVDLNIQASEKKLYLIEYYGTRNADTLIAYTDEPIESEIWQSYWSRYSNTKKGPIGW